MAKVFTPFSVLIGLLSGILASKIFEFVWSKIDDEDAPDPKFRSQPYTKLTIALIVQGAIQRLVRGYVDHGLRIAWARTIGEWPGDEEPQPD
jgi:hypothetical protein